MPQGDLKTKCHYQSRARLLAEPVCIDIERADIREVLNKDTRPLCLQVANPLYLSVTYLGEGGH